MINELQKESVQTFILENEYADPFELTLKFKDVDGVPISVISQQIAAKKIAKKKYPEWYDTKGLVYPSKLSLEQSSSELTAQYKASLVSGKSFIDLTGGMGVDSWALSKVFDRGIYVEQQADLKAITEHNLNKLGANNIEVVCRNAEEYFDHSKNLFDLIYVDPARRNERQQKVFRLHDCSPNVVALLPKLLEQSAKILLKTSPMMDIDLALAVLNNVSEVHVLSVDNECKEVLYLIEKEFDSSDISIYTTNYHHENIQSFVFTKRDEKVANSILGEPEEYLYEPNASIMKSGAYKFVGAHFGLKKLHVNTHLYTSDQNIEEFPGRRFLIQSVLPNSKKAIRAILPTPQANLATRNFPTDVQSLRKKLGLKDGGDYFLFACTLMNNKPCILVCSKVN